MAVFDGLVAWPILYTEYNRRKNGSSAVSKRGVVAPNSTSLRCVSGCQCAERKHDFADTRTSCKHLENVQPHGAKNAQSVRIINVCSSSALTQY